MTWAGQRGKKAQDSVTLLRKVHTLKRMNYLFLKVVIYYFRIVIDCG